MLPFLSLISTGSGLNAEDILFGFGICSLGMVEFISILSHPFSSLGVSLSDLRGCLVISYPCMVVWI